MLHGIVVGALAVVRAMARLAARFTSASKISERDDLLTDRRFLIRGIILSMFKWVGKRASVERVG